MPRPSLAALREEEFPEAARGVYLDTASFGLLPRRTVEAVRSMTEARAGPGGFHESDLGDALARAREAAARLVGCRVREVSLAPNTSYGVNLGAHLVAQGPPGTVVISDGEFPANVFPWMALEDRGFHVERVPSDALGRPDEARLMERIREPDVRALALSAVQFSTGYRADLEAFGRLCGEEDVLFVVDAIQALGAVPLDMKSAGVDVLASGAQKWLCSPWGSGFVCVDEAHHDRFDPPMVSWLGMEEAMDFDRLLEYRYHFAPDGRKFELATLGIQDHAGMARSLELFLEVGIGGVRAHLEDVQAPLWTWIEGNEGNEAVRAVTPRDPEKRAGIVAMRVDAVEQVAEALREIGVVAAVRDGALRLSPHLYNTRREMEAVVERLDEAVAGRVC